MYIYNSIPHIINTLNLGKELLQVLFEKRNRCLSDMNMPWISLMNIS